MKNKNQYYNCLVEGIRGFAIILVILFHSNINYFKNCFIGVDLTFFLSGYLLMKSYIYSDGKYFFSTFIIKRLYRILPYFSILLLIMFICQISNGINEIRLIKDYFCSSLFVSNIYFKYENEDYFFLVNPSKLLHTWSLSVEMQFYVLFPIFINIYRLNFVVYTIVLYFVSLISLLYEAYNVCIGERSIYYSFFGRLWEFTVGMIVAMNKYRYSKRFNSDILILLLISIPFINIKMNITLFRVVELLLCLIILENENNYSDENNEEKANKSTNSISIILTNKILKYIGKLSYPLYLLHYPLLKTSYNLYCKIILIYILSEAFYMIVEYSFNTNRVSYKQKIFVIVILFLLPITPIIIVYIKFNILSSYVNIKSANIDDNKQIYSKINILEIPSNVLSQYKSLQLNLHSFDNLLNYSKIEYLSTGEFLARVFKDSYRKTDIDEKSDVWLKKPIAYFIGDSYCMQWMGVIKRYCSERNITLIYTQILMRDFLKNKAKEFMKEVLLEEMIKERNIHFEIIFIAFSLNMNKYYKVADIFNIEYPILIKSLSVYTDCIIAFEGTPITYTTDDDSTMICNACVVYKLNRCYTILGKNISYSEHYQPIYLNNYHTIDFYEKQFCYNKICSCVINNTFVYDSFGHVNPSILKLFQNEMDDNIDEILNKKFKKVKEYDESDRNNLFVNGYLVQNRFMRLLLSNT